MTSSITAEGGLPSLYRRGTDIFGCRKSPPPPNNKRSVAAALPAALPPLLSVNDMLIYGRDEIAHMKDIRKSLGSLVTKPCEKNTAEPHRRTTVQKKVNHRYNYNFNMLRQLVYSDENEDNDYNIDSDDISEEIDNIINDLENTNNNNNDDDENNDNFDSSRNNNNVNFQIEFPNSIDQLQQQQQQQQQQLEIEAIEPLTAEEIEMLRNEIQNIADEEENERNGDQRNEQNSEQSDQINGQINGQNQQQEEDEEKESESMQMLDTYLMMAAGYSDYSIPLPNDDDDDETTENGIENNGNRNNRDKDDKIDDALSFVSEMVRKNHNSLNNINNNIGTYNNNSNNDEDKEKVDGDVNVID